MKLTRHNGRAGKYGVYNPRHNDRNFDVRNSEHIVEERVKQNIYWDCYNGFRQLNPPDDESLAKTFEDVEELYYHTHYLGYVLGQNERNEKNRHPERNRTTTDIRKRRQTAPEETVYQLGTLEEHVGAEELTTIFVEFIKEFDERFGKYVHILDWALHVDEGTPHIQERHVFDCLNRYGELAVQQEKACELLGFELPDPSKPVGKKNNRKMSFDATCRVMLFDICKRHGLHLEEEPEYGGRAYLEKNDYILMRQKEKMQQQQSQLDDLMMRTSDIERFVDEVTDVCYDKAVEVVSDAVAEQAHREDVELIEKKKEWITSPERKAPQKVRDYAVARLNEVITSIQRSTEALLQRVRISLSNPETKQKNKEAIKSRARQSVLQLLSQAKERADSEANARQATDQQRKQNMEL